MGGTSPNRHLSELDGEGRVRAIRQTPSLATLPVLAVTADVEVRDKAAEMGFNGILLKPVTTDTLVKAFSGDSSLFFKPVTNTEVS